MSAQVGPQWRLAYAMRVREAMGPGMRAAFDALREISPDAKLTWLDTETIKHGGEPGGICTTWGGVRRSP